MPSQTLRKKARKANNKNKPSLSGPNVGRSPGLLRMDKGFGGKSGCQSSGKKLSKRK